MTREEKIEVMFESILSEIEKLRDSRDENSNTGKVQSDFPVLDQKLNEFLKKFSAVKLQVQPPNLQSLESKIERWTAEIKSLQADGQTGIKSVKESGVSKGWLIWLVGIPNLRVIVVCTVLITAFTVISINLYRRSQTFKSGYEKYQFLYHSGNRDYLHELDSIWKIDSLREQRLRFIELRESEMNSQNQQLESWK